MNLILKRIVSVIAVIALVCFAFSPKAFANNPPDSGHSTLSASGQAPADGSSTVTVTVTLQDSSGNALSGDNVTFSDPGNSTAVLNPSSSSLNSSGQTTFTITSTNAQTDNITVTDTSSNTTLSNLGQVTFTPITTPTPTPSCTDAAPGSTPQITSAVANNTSQITLTFTDATGSVGYYLLSFGLASGQYIYGAPNIGPQGTTSYTVNSLASNTKYYFVIKAVNGCSSSSFSNEVSTTTLGAPTPTPTVAPTDTPIDTPIPDSSASSDTPTDTPAPSLNADITTTPAPTFIAGIEMNPMIYIVASTILLLILGIALYLYKRNSRKDTNIDIHNPHDDSLLPPDNGLNSL